MSDVKFKFSIKYQLKTFRFALKGLGSFFIHEHKAYIHSTAALLVIIAGFIFELNTTEWCLAVLAISLVIAAEIVNSAIESMVDLASPGQHPLAGRAKDLGAAAVLICSLGAAVIGTLIFLPKIIVYAQ